MSHKYTYDVLITLTVIYIIQVSQFRSKRMLRTIQDDQTTNDSPKISFRWEVESCSTFSSALSVSSTNKNDQHVNFEIHPNPNGNSSIVTLRSGSWITTDSDCKSLYIICNKKMYFLLLKLKFNLTVND